MSSVLGRKTTAQITRHVQNCRSVYFGGFHCSAILRCLGSFHWC